MHLRISLKVIFISLATLTVCPALGVEDTGYHYRGKGEGDLTLTILPEPGGYAARIDVKARNCSGSVMGKVERQGDTGTFKAQPGNPGDYCTVKFIFSKGMKQIDLDEVDCVGYHGKACSFSGKLTNPRTIDRASIVAASKEKVLATVNGKPVGANRVLHEYAQIPADLVKGKEDSVMKQLLDRIIDQVLVEQEARRLNAESDPGYQEKLRIAKLQLLANTVVEKKISEILTDNVLRTYYEANKKSFSYPAIKAKHILVPTQSEALDIIKIISPPIFSDLAKTRSKGPSAEQGGDLGWFKPEAMIPEFAEVARTVPIGTVAPSPIKTAFGWHVLYIEERKADYVPPFDEVKSKIRETLAKDIPNTYLRDLRKNSTIIYN